MVLPVSFSHQKYSTEREKRQNRQAYETVGIEFRVERQKQTWKTTSYHQYSDHIFRAHRASLCLSSWWARQK